MKTITKPRTIKKLMEFFECSEMMAKQLQGLYAAGLNHGKQGMYKDGDFSNHKDWLSGSGHDIRTLENSLHVTDSSVFDIYDDGHDAGLQIYIMGSMQE